jgi:hypothetical protein
MPRRSSAPLTHGVPAPGPVATAGTPTIVVSRFGVANVPAERATIQLVIGSGFDAMLPLPVAVAPDVPSPAVAAEEWAIVTGREDCGVAIADRQPVTQATIAASVEVDEIRVSAAPGLLRVVGPGGGALIESSLAEPTHSGRRSC